MKVVIENEKDRKVAEKIRKEIYSKIKNNIELYEQYVMLTEAIEEYKRDMEMKMFLLCG